MVIKQTARAISSFDRLTMTNDQTTFYARHHGEISQTARYAKQLGRTNVVIVNDDSPEEIGQGYFRAVNFDWNGATVEARTVFDVQYHFS